MCCHIYAIGLESTFNTHSNTHHSFLKVQIHLLSGKGEMQVTPALRQICLCEREGAERHVWSIGSAAPE